MRHFRLDYRFWLLVATLFIVLQWFTFDRVTQCKLNMSSLMIESEAQGMLTEIKQSILDKQRATTAIALTLSNEFSKLPLDETLSENLEVEQLMQQIKQFSDYKNLWIQVVSPDGQSIYRSWSAFRNNLTKIRPEFAEVEKKRVPVIGISAGTFDLSIKVVAPIMRQGELVGFLDLISHFNSIQHRLKRIGIDSIVVATQQRSEIMRYPFSSHRIGPYYVANLEPDADFFNDIALTDLQHWITMEKNYLRLGEQLLVRHPLTTVNQEVHGYLFARADIDNMIQKDDELTELKLRMNLYIIADVVFVILIAMLIALYWVRRQKNYYKAILNYEDEAVLVTNGERLIDANQQLYRYFPKVKDKKGDCICNYFENKPGFISKYVNGLLWIDHVVKYDDQNHKAMVIVDGVSRIFQVKVRELSRKERLFVVVMFDITEMEALNRKLHSQSRTDELTQTGNRLAFNENLKREVELANRNGQPLSVVIFDIDYFKKINDRFGHAEGDQVLKTMTSSIKQQLRKTDSLFRIGGEEFVLILAMQDSKAALKVADKIRSMVAEIEFSKSEHVSISLGVTQLLATDDHEAVLARADNALYKAKREGRNRAVLL